MFERSTEKARRAIFFAHRGTVREKPASAGLPLTPECKRALAHAAEEAEQLHHGRIGAGHLLFGLLREEECFAADLLHRRGVGFNQVREKLASGQQGGDHV